MTDYNIFPLLKKAKPFLKLHLQHNNPNPSLLILSGISLKPVTSDSKLEKVYCQDFYFRISNHVRWFGFCTAVMQVL